MAQPVTPGPTFASESFAALEAVDDTLEHIALNSHGYQLVHREVRRAVLRRFPAVSIFVFTEMDVVVFAVLHASRHPIQWRNRV
jgi:toxin ParE1/3/4